MTEELKYPVGRAQARTGLAAAERGALIEEIAAAPAALRQAVLGLDDHQLDTPYRPEGWTVRQVVHHVADSHMNAFIRLKLALTEDTPTIKPYDQDRWARLPDARLPIDVSLDLVDRLHQRWVTVLRGMPDADFARAFDHPESGRVTLEAMLQLYVWHGRHHTAHITGLRQRLGW
jgi:uncharacterized damage-inducible protein DinB